MKGLMKLLFLFSFFSVFLFSFASAQNTCSSPEDTLLKLESDTNAHGERWDQSNYNYEICFRDLFPGYSVGATPNSCTGSNLVLRLSDDTNAHAQAPDYGGSNIYPEDVCYEGLTCVSSLSDCAVGQVEVVSLSADTNAHLETATADNYNRRICCTASTAPQILDAKWLYYDGTEIVANTLVCPSQAIIAKARTMGIADFEEIIFTFLDDDVGSPDPILPVPLTSNIEGNQANISLNLADPTIRSILYSKLDGSPSRVELYFEASSSVVPGIARSVELSYTDDESLCSFNPPQASVDAPVHRGVYYANTNIPFTSGCTSQIGPVTNEWTITPQNGQAFTETQASFTHPFTQAGQVNVKLKCTDLDGRFDVNESQILVVASPNVLAYINQPKLNEIIYSGNPSSTPYFPTEVSFSASDSFVVNTISSTSPCSIECLGGNCPAQTQNSPAACGTNPVGGPITITQTTNSYSSLLFNWTFLDSDWTNEWATYETGNGIYSGNVQYDDLSNTLNDKRVRVSVKHTSGASAEFEREFTLGRCLNNENTYYSSMTQSSSTNSPNSACKGGDGNAGTADDCCASGLECLADGDDPSNPARYFCQVPPGGPILECDDFTTSSACNSNTNTAIPQASYGGNPPACTSLRCQWDPLASGGNGACGLNITTYQSSSTTGACSSGPGAIITNSCSYTTTVSECTNGRKTITYSTSGGASCQRNPVVVPCGSLSFELSFFTLREFLISMLLIGAIYFVFSLRNKNNEK